ncbi:MAG: orotate phosphoribosyltransferase [Candidatus Coatesbacteria bacterium]|nr:MAG: orotate phosphoribosyltransferase [Candidatus Coatesbacteria bacterium]
MSELFDIPVAEARAEMLALLRAVAYEEGDFTLASGKKSKYYIDGRRVTMHPRGAVLTGLLFWEEIRDLVPAEGPFGISGLTMGADPVITATALVAAARGHELYPFYCRKEAKGHGAGRQLEGYYDGVASCVLVEDTATTGRSILKAAAAVEAAGVRPVAGILLVDREEGAREAIEEAGLAFRAVFSVRELQSG